MAIAAEVDGKRSATPLSSPETVESNGSNKKIVLKTSYPQDPDGLCPEAPFCPVKAECLTHTIYERTKALERKLDGNGRGLTTTKPLSEISDKELERRLDAGRNGHNGSKHF